jgi:aromatic ring hydroxylase
MNPFDFEGFDFDELADAVIFVDDIIPWSEVLIALENRRVFEARGEAGIGDPMAK